MEDRCVVIFRITQPNFDHLLDSNTSIHLIQMVELKMYRGGRIWYVVRLLLIMSMSGNRTTLEYCPSHGQLPVPLNAIILIRKIILIIQCGHYYSKYCDKLQMSRNWWKIRVNHLYQNRLSFMSVDWIMLNRNMILKIQYGCHIWQTGHHCLDRHNYVNITIKSTKLKWRKSINYNFVNNKVVTIDSKESMLYTWQLILMISY